MVWPEDPELKWDRLCHLPIFDGLFAAIDVAKNNVSVGRDVFINEASRSVGKGKDCSIDVHACEWPYSVKSIDDSYFL